MKRSTLIILAVIGVLVIWAVTVRNGLASSQVDINGKWGQVENQFERKMKLYENVVLTIKGSAKNEDTTLLKIVSLRSHIDPNNPQTLLDANRQLDQARSSIAVNIEAYPTIQTTQAYRDFQTEIERTESRVANAIMDWNNAITDYNNKVVRFPGNLLAGMFGYKQKENFKSDTGAKDAKPDFN